MAQPRNNEKAVNDVSGICEFVLYVCMCACVHVYRVCMCTVPCVQCCVYVRVCALGVCVGRGGGGICIMAVHTT